MELEKYIYICMPVLLQNFRKCFHGPVLFINLIFAAKADGVKPY